MKIDTLVLSGGALKCIAFTGVFEYLFSENIIDSKLTHIKTILSLSGGTLFSLPLLLGFDIQECKSIIFSSNFSNMTDIRDFSLHNIFSHYGFFDNKFIKYFIIQLCLYKGYHKNLSLLELYTIKKINFKVVVFNLSKNKEEIFSYKTHPHIPLWKLCMMTSCIPFIYKPIHYKGCQYIDGGMLSCNPIHLNTSPHFLEIFINSHKDVTIHNDKIIHKNIFEYITHITRYIHEPTTDELFKTTKNDKRRISLSIANKDGYNFSINSQTIIKIYRLGFIQTGRHFSKH